MTIRLLALVLLVGALAAACGGDDDGDLEAYCALVIDGVGVDFDTGVVEPGEYAALLEVAPPEIHDTVQQLANATVDLAEITELDQLFDAAFDPEAQAAKERFDAFAVDGCGVDADALPDGRVESSEALLADLDAYIETNFGNQTWTPKVTFDVERVRGALEGIKVSFVDGSVDDEAISVCNAVRPYLYEIRNADGVIEVVEGDLVLARSDGPDEDCVAL